MTAQVKADTRQIIPPEDRYAEELAFLAAYDDGPRPPGWRLTPSAVVTFIVGSDGRLRRAKAKSAGESIPMSLEVERKYVGPTALVERCVVTLAGSRGLLLTGEPGTAKSMLSELLSTAICGSSSYVVQGTAGTTEDHLRYGWNYAQLLAEGPSEAALVPSPIMAAMSGGAIARVEEITRCLPEVQDALVSLLSERRIAIPELGDTAVAAQTGFAVIATANLRDKGVSEMSAALKRRFNFEQIDPIAEFDAEVALVTSQVAAALTAVGAPTTPDATVIDVLVTAFRDMRSGITAEGWSVEKPTSVLSTAEAVATATSAAMATAWFPGRGDGLRLVPRLLLGTVRKDDPDDAARLLGYWDQAVARRSQAGDPSWRTLWDLRGDLESR